MRSRVHICPLFILELGFKFEDFLLLLHCSVVVLIQG